MSSDSSFMELPITQRLRRALLIALGAPVLIALMSLPLIDWSNMSMRYRGGAPQSALAHGLLIIALGVLGACSVALVAPHATTRVRRALIGALSALPFSVALAWAALDMPTLIGRVQGLAFATCVLGVGVALCWPALTPTSHSIEQKPATPGAT